VIVLITGVLARAPLSRVPENALKFTVGIMLTSFGIFWGAEGTGVSWPGGELALLAVLAFVAVVAVASVAILRRGRRLELAPGTAS
jgi:uncharacterized membrane protein